MQNKYELIKLASKSEKYGGKIKQDKMRQLKEKYQCEIVYMPYGENGAGFYKICLI